MTFTTASKERASAMRGEAMRVVRHFWRDTVGHELSDVNPRQRQTSGERNGRGGSTFRVEWSFRDPRDTTADIAAFLRYAENSDVWPWEQFPMSMPRHDTKYPTLVLDLSALLEIDRSGYLATVADAKAARLTPHLLAPEGQGFKGLQNARTVTVTPSVNPVSFKGQSVKDLILPTNLD